MTGWHGEQSIFKTMKRQWNILITGSWLLAWTTIGFSKQWKVNGIFWSLDHDCQSSLTGRHAEQWDFQIMNLLISGSWLKVLLC
jgi:hypothetical protein